MYCHHIDANQTSIVTHNLVFGDCCFYQGTRVLVSAPSLPNFSQSIGNATTSIKSH